MMRLKSLLFLVLVPGSLLAQDLSEKLSFQPATAPTAVILQELSTKSGVFLQAGASVRGDVLAISVKDVSLQELMDKLAATLDAEWQQRDGGFLLVRTEVTERKQESAEEEALAKRIQDELGKLKQQSAGQPFDAAKARELVQKLSANRAKRNDRDSKWYTELDALTKGSPLTRASYRLVADLDAKAIARQPEGYRIVYSNNPNRMQQPLKGDHQAILGQLLAEQRIYAEAAKGLGGQEEEGVYYNVGAEFTSELATPPSKVLVAVTRSVMEGTRAEVVFVSDKGRIITRESVSIYNPFDAFEDLQQAEPLKEGEKKITLSPLSLSFAKELQARFTFNEEMQPLSEGEIRQRILNPEKHEPLDLLVTDLVRGIAEISGSNVIVQAQDLHLATIGITAIMSDLSMDRGMRAIEAAQTEWVKQEGWLLAKPTQPATERHERMDREALGQFLRRTASKGRASLDDFGAYAITVTREMPFLDALMMMLILPEGVEPVFMGQLELLRFYGSLTSAQKSALKQQQALPFSSLNPQQAELVSKMVFGMHPNIHLPESASVGQIGMTMTEATELLPSGIPGATAIKAMVVDGPVYFGFANGQWGRRKQPLRAEDLGWERFTIERADLFPWAVEQGSYTEFVEGKHTSWHFEFEFPQGGTMQNQLEDSEITQGAPKLKFEQLPQQFREKVAARIKELREAYKDAKPGDMGGGTRRVPPLN